MKTIKFTTVGITDMLPYCTAYGSAIDMIVELRNNDIISILENFTLEEIIYHKELDCSKLKEYIQSLEKDCEDEN